MNYSAESYIAALNFAVSTGSGQALQPKAQGWPEPYIYTISDRIFGDFPAKNTVYLHRIYMVLANPTKAVSWCLNVPA
jgi:hypothetical protein